MKTKNNLWKVLVMATVLTSYQISGNKLSAQSDPDHPGVTELNMALSQLESFMIESEHSIRYKAPSGEYDELLVAIEGLETENISNDLNYHAPDFEALTDKTRQKKAASRDLFTQKKNSETEYSKNQSL